MLQKCLVFERAESWMLAETSMVIGIFVCYEKVTDEHSKLDYAYDTLG
jgi:hypothetical protein